MTGGFPSTELGLPGTEDFDAADGFAEIFPEMSDIADQRMIGLDGNGSHEYRSVFIPQVGGAGDMRVYKTRGAEL